MNQLSYLKVDTAAEKLLREAPPAEQPLERLEKLGPVALSITELLQIALDCRNDPLLPLRLLERWKSLSELTHASPHDLRRVEGMTRGRVARLRAALELARRAQVPDEKPHADSPQAVAALLMPEMSGLDREEFRVVLLNNQNRVVGIHRVYQGSVHTTVLRTAEVFAEAVRANVPSIIIAHNHPASGDVSPEDIATTKELAEAAKLLDIELLDHIVIRQGSFISLKQRGLF